MNSVEMTISVTANNFIESSGLKSPDFITLISISKVIRPKSKTDTDNHSSRLLIHPTAVLTPAFGVGCF